MLGRADGCDCCASCRSAAAWRRSRTRCTRAPRRCRSSSPSSSARSACRCWSSPAGGVQLTPHAEILVEHTDGDPAAPRAGRVGRPRVGRRPRSAPSGWRSSSRPRWRYAARARPAASEHPGLRVTVTQREPETALLETLARDFDLVVAEQYPGHAAPWHAEPRPGRAGAGRRSGWRCRPEWDGIGTLADAADVPWVAEPHGAASRHYAEQACRRPGSTPTSATRRPTCRRTSR